MPFNKADKIWMNGKLVNWDDAKIHVLSHVVHYGSSVFEGMRCYNTPKGPACFRLQEHTDRLFNSAKIYRMEIPFSKDDINEAVLNLIAVNKLDECYIRPIVYRGYDTLGVDPRKCPVDVTIAAWAWGKYLGEDAMENGVSVCVSSWNRNAPNTMPMMAKAGANYMNSQLIKLEAISHGYVEGIALDTRGMVSEGSGENIFVVQRGALVTPSFCCSILPGITRNTVISLATESGMKVIEQPIPREALYIADEVFFTGSAAEITPISKIDGIVIGNGKAGEYTKKLQKKFFDVVEGRMPDEHHWLTFVR
ncbi:MAG: branched-chain amino acid transaminase [candidate division Zixibacteria bacterium]|nr:branched-chain amino acid transaminase [candidate division Zixibacteria bacterium]